MNKKQRNTRRMLALILVPILLLLACIYGLTYGSVPISPGEVWSILFDQHLETVGLIIMDLRLPRVLIGLLVGACLATSGALLQGIMGNPLADPGIIGISSGGGLAAVIMMILLPQYSYLLPAGAFIGAFLAAIAIYALAWDTETSPIRIVLAGVAINALLGAAMNGIMVTFSDRVQAVLPWLAGGLTGRSWHHLAFAAPYALAGLALSLLTIKPANLLLLGDDSARLLGLRAEPARFLIIMVAALLAGIAVSVAGLIGFVGLVVPHTVRLLLGEDYCFLLPVSMLSGGALVVIADAAARTWFDPVELPVGILLAAIGAPFFLILLRKRRLTS